METKAQKVERLQKTIQSLQFQYDNAKGRKRLMLFKSLRYHQEMLKITLATKEQ